MDVRLDVEAERWATVKSDVRYEVDVRDVDDEARAIEGPDAEVWWPWWLTALPSGMTSGVIWRRGIIRPERVMEACWGDVDVR